MAMSVFSYPASLRKCAVSDGLLVPHLPLISQMPWEASLLMGAVRLAVACCVSE